MGRQVVLVLDGCRAAGQGQFTDKVIAGVRQSDAVAPGVEVRCAVHGQGVRLIYRAARGGNQIAGHRCRAVAEGQAGGVRRQIGGRALNFQAATRGKRTVAGRGKRHFQRIGICK